MWSVAVQFEGYVLLLMAPIDVSVFRPISEAQTEPSPEGPSPEAVSPFLSFLTERLISVSSRFLWPGIPIPKCCFLPLMAPSIPWDCSNWDIPCMDNRQGDTLHSKLIEILRFDPMPTKTYQKLTRYFPLPAWLRLERMWASPEVHHQPLARVLAYFSPINSTHSRNLNLCQEQSEFTIVYKNKY